MMSNTDFLTAEDLRKRLYHSLREKGLVDALKSQLRNKLVSELRHVGVQQTFEPDVHHSTEGSLLHKASNSLVVDHLRHCHYDYSLSVFLPECAIPENQLFTVRDMLQLLNISPQSRLYKNLMRHIDGENEKGFLWQLLCEVASSCGSSCRDSASQTDYTRLPVASSLEEQFSKVDDYYTSLEDGHKHGSVAVEQRLLTYQRQLDERSRTDTQLEIARFKENELARMRLEEREKTRLEVDRLRREIEASYQSKCTSLSERERHSVERLQKEQQIAEKETFNQRQSLLEEIEAVRQRESNIRRTVEVDQREKNLWEEKMKTKEVLMKKREEDVRKAEIEYNQKLHDATQKFKLEEQARLLERSKDLDYREVRVRENERRLDDELRNVDHMKTDLREKNKMCNNLEGELMKVKHELIGARGESELLSGRVREMVDYQVVKEDNAIMRREMDNLKTRIAEMTRDVLLERQKNEELLREMTERASKPTPEVYLMQKQLDKVRNEMKQERAVFEHQKQNMDQRCQDEVERSRDLLRKYEEQTYQLEEMNREIRDLHHQLGHTKTALTNEVYRKPKASLLNRSRSPCDLDEVDPALIQVSDQPQLLFSASHGLIDNILDRHQAARPVTGVNSSRSDDYSYSMDLVEDTKHRLRNLEKEAENLDHHYQNFQYRMTSAGGVLDNQMPPAPAAPSRDVQYTQSKAMASHSARVAFTDTVDTRTVMSPSRNKHLKASIAETQPLSSTPTRRSIQDLESLPTHTASQSSNKLYGDSSLIDNSMSTVQSSPVLRDTSRSGLPARPLSVDDLECRPGSPDIVVLHSSGAESQRTHNSAPVNQAMAPPTSVQPPTITSLDDAWKTQANKTEENHRREDERRRQEEEDKAYEEEQARRAEDRKKREQAAWEAEQRQLAQLQGKPMNPVSTETVAETDTRPEAEPAVDPVMLKYMQMVEQNKLKEKEVAQNTMKIWNKGKKDKTPSVSEDISLADEKSSEDVSDGDFW